MRGTVTMTPSDVMKILKEHFAKLGRCDVERVAVVTGGTEIFDISFRVYLIDEVGRD